MYAIVRDNTFDVTKVAAGVGGVATFRTAHAGQPGYCGSVVVDAGDGRQLSLTLWRTQADAEAARRALGPVIGRTLRPLMSKPSILVGLGDVIFDDISPSSAARKSRNELGSDHEGEGAP